MTDRDKVQAAVNRLTGYTQYVQVDLQEYPTFVSDETQED